MMEYRICLATSGSYYVQRRSCCGNWKMFGNFYRSKAGARAFVADLKRQPCCDKVVEYL